jgi:hypothetical protein
MAFLSSCVFNCPVGVGCVCEVHSARHHEVGSVLEVVPTGALCSVQTRKTAEWLGPGHENR